MSVSYETIIQKMMDELQTAKGQQNNDAKLKSHINNVRLLCDLILDGAKSAKAGHTVTEAEMKAMLGSKQTSDQKIKREQSSFDETNSDSIFDF